MSLGRILKNIRVARDLSREEVVAPKYSISHLAAVEQGVKRPSIRMLTHVADRLRVSLEMLVPEVMENGIPVPEMIRLARSLCRESKFDLALDILQQANDKDEEDGGQYRVDRLEAEAYVQFRRNSLQRALELYSEVSKIRERGGNPLLIAEAYHSMGLVERERDRLQQASHWFFIAWERLLPVHTRHQNFALDLLVNYGETLSEIGQFRTARSIYERSIDLMTPDNESQDHVAVLRGIARCATETGDLADAEDYLCMAVDRAEKTTRQHFLAGLLTELGTVIRLQGRPHQALPHVVRALGLIDDLGSNPLATINEIFECHLAHSDGVADEIDQWDQRITHDILEKAPAGEKTLYLVLKSEILMRKALCQEALETAREAFSSSAYDSPGNLHLRILAVAVDASRTGGDLTAMQWVVDQLRCMARAAQ